MLLLETGKYAGKGCNQYQECAINTHTERDQSGGLGEGNRNHILRVYLKIYKQIHITPIAQLTNAPKYYCFNLYCITNHSKGKVVHQEKGY